MHILYVDEAGTQREARHFVVASVSLFERQTYHLADELSRLQARYFPEEPGLLVPGLYGAAGTSEEPSVVAGAPACLAGGARGVSCAP